MSCISSVIFVAADLYQGVAGVIVTAILGLIFSAIVLTTGTVVPMILRSANLADFAAQATARCRSIL